MEEFMVNFHFLRPWWLLLLLMPLYGYFRFAGSLQRASAWEAVCDKNLLRFLLIKGSSRQRSRVVGLCLTGLIGAILALAGPSWQKREIPAMIPENPLMLALNLSSDMAKTDVTPDRLSRAKYAVADLLKLVPGTQAGLIVYTNEPFLISPITEDTAVLENLLPAVTRDIVPENGDRLDRAIDLAAARLENAGYGNGNIVVFAADVGQEFEGALKAAAAAAAKGYTVSTVAVGAVGSEKLRLVADRGNGLYMEIGADIPVLAQYLNDTRRAQLSESRNAKEIWEDFGYYLLFLPLVCCLYLFRRGIMAIALAVVWAQSAQAGFFLNNNQEGLRDFERQDYQSAAEKFDDSAWKASAYYRLGDYQKALEHFSQGGGAEALYNQGNALAKSGETEAAIAKYEEVLKQEPNHEDAKFNLEYLKRQQQQNQSSSSQNQKQDEQQPEDQQSSQSEQQPQQNERQQQQQAAQNNAGNGAEQQQQQPENAEDGNDGEPQSAADREKTENSPDNTQSSGAEDEEHQPGEDKTPAAARPGGETEENAPKYDEQIQAREQQFRDIPEDNGGLLRAFIKKEYMKNRYKDK